ncbi:hypothetical protein GQX73_g526 [Xylaria multiplex]|uniref:Uncharacterized protein n=1 Tax=Xylaria multiplex TaxID=323545 RepID=A0A7C8IV28_9PEZI|nr:hypothetical protein GQX73_g526 [Xylaria multiplex]
MRNALGAPDHPAWGYVFPKVARRYFYLRSARPRRIEKIDIVSQTAHDNSFREVEPWNRWLRWNDNIAIFQDRDPRWCLEDRLLIYRENVSSGYVAYDLETRRRFSVPFEGADKIVRRLRLAHSILVIEWCERESREFLNLGKIHRHFATAFNVRRSTEPGSTNPLDTWEIRFRSEWEMYHRGLPVTRLARFFSTHTATHYALYLWQYDDSLVGESAIEEQITVWNIEGISPYRPSKDSLGAHRPDPTQPQPMVIKRFMESDLSFFGIRQRDEPSLREILLDEQNIYIHGEDHRWLAGEHSSPIPPRNHYVSAVGIPLSGVGPNWFDHCCADGDIHMSFCPRAGSVARFGDGNRSGISAQFDGTWAGRAPCWRHEEFPYLTLSDVVDSEAEVRIVARQCFMMEALSSFVLPKISLKAEPDETPEVRFTDDMWRQLLGRGKIMGDDRWVVGEDWAGNITVVRF